MIKIIGVGLWVCLVTLAASYGAVYFSADKHVEVAKDTPAGKLETIKTRMISVPIVGDGALHGYVMMQFVFTMDAAAAKSMRTAPELIFADEAFKTIYVTNTPDFRNFRKQDLQGLTKTITDSVNKRFGAALVQDVLIQELSFVPKDRLRGGGRS
jgi:hypothetical protein